ncbi:MAG: MazG-like family protein [Bacillota bacterium]|uniref:MazG-like family protein n=1 Tax=Desulfurispora thermophila TaxID=265470 RepID=UPI00036A0CA7|nr:MazG-like family protein [Desulfurispora thermophila]
MPFAGKEVGIAHNMKMIEWLKVDLLSSVTALFRGMARASEELILDALASLIITCYVLGRRLGFSFSRLDLHLTARLRSGVENGPAGEEWYQDLSALQEYLDTRQYTPKR